MWLVLTGCRGVFDSPPTPIDTGAVDADGVRSDSGGTPAGSSMWDGSLEVACTPEANPLRYTCTVLVDPPQPVQLSWARDDGLGVERVAEGDGDADTHVLPVMFLAPEQAYTVTATSVEETARVGFTTGSVVGLPDTWLEMDGRATTGLVGTDVPCSNDAIAVVYDTHTGDLVWYGSLGPGSLGFLDMAMFTPERTVAAETGIDLVEIDLRGEELVRIVDARGIVGADPFNIGLHHDVYRQDGKWYVMFREEQHGNPDDFLDVIAILDDSGEVIGRWDPADHLAIPEVSSGDFLHTNAVWVDEAGDIYLSWKNIDTIGKITGDPSSPDFGTVQWVIAGKEPVLEQPHLEVDWDGIDGPDNFFNQHNLILTPAGEVGLLDNGNGRGLILEVDEEAGTVTATGQFPTEKNSCGAQGTHDVTESGHVIVGCMEGKLHEYDRATDTVVWEATVRCADDGGQLLTVPRWTALDAW